MENGMITPIQSLSDPARTAVNPLPLLLLLILNQALCLAPARSTLALQHDQREQARSRIQIEDALKYIYLCEMEGRRPSLPGIAGRLQIPENQAATLVQSMQNQDLVLLDGLELRLTDDARAYALHAGTGSSPVGASPRR